MNSGFRRYTSMTGDGAAKPPDGTMTRAPQALPSAGDVAKIKKWDNEKNQFGEMRSFVMSLSMKGSGPNVALFDYGYFGNDEEEVYAGRGGGSSAGGGSKLTNDSKQAPSPFSSIFGGS